jgi:hypothetical protein
MARTEEMDVKESKRNLHFPDSFLNARRYDWSEHAEPLVQWMYRRTNKAYYQETIQVVGRYKDVITYMKRRFDESEMHATGDLMSPLWLYHIAALRALHANVTIAK